MLTSSPPLETPQTVCALTNLALMLKYLTFLQNKTRMLKCDLWPPTAQEWGGGTAAMYPGLPRHRAHSRHRGCPEAQGSPGMWGQRWPGFC